ncbi:hypothetical protein F2P81_003886 [Xyrichtys novacula]|uniref:Uncharacterized protein n=1 Tax=Xyrichtys novacula TaxID=13765 RepID=A0AAV1GV66_XYRNO|nr:hypothetical protein F2P81_003886 [Xyrichtys novacula]
MPPKPAKQQNRRNNSEFLNSISKETDTNANNMTALANAVTAVQASINSFREENRASIASLHWILSVYGQQITEVEDGMNEFDKRLSSMETSQNSLAKGNKAVKEKVSSSVHPVSPIRGGECFSGGLGTDTDNLIRRMLAAALTNGLASQYNWASKHDQRCSSTKKPFKNTAMQGCLLVKVHLAV